MSLVGFAAPMAAVPEPSKLYPLFTLSADDPHAPGNRNCRRGGPMVGLAIAMFIALFGWGARYFGWDDPQGKIQLALGVSFILGVLSGYKAKS
jgi:hypothetical protein